MNKSELLTWLTDEQQKWELLLAAIGHGRMDQPGVNGDWSMRDIVAHVTVWQRWLVARLAAAGEGRAEPLPPWPPALASEDDINAWIYDSNRNRTIRQVLDDASGIHYQLLATIQGLPDDCQIDTIEGKFHVIWVNDQRFPAGEIFHHFYDDHAADVLSWLKRGA